jgi:alkyl hydroperoxide reductase subunit D
MARLDAVRDALPDFARDAKLNLASVLGPGALGDAQRWGVAVATAAAARHRPLLDAMVADALATVGPAVVDDALAAASLMAMNNVFYRFRHFVEGHEAEYARRPARLRMQRIGKPATSRADFELFCLAVSAVNGCESCVRAHEHTVREHGVSIDQVHDAIRIASTIHAVAVSLEAAAALPSPAVQTATAVPT